MTRNLTAFCLASLTLALFAPAASVWAQNAAQAAQAQATAPRPRGDAVAPAEPPATIEPDPQFLADAELYDAVRQRLEKATATVNTLKDWLQELAPGLQRRAVAHPGYTWDQQRKLFVKDAPRPQVAPPAIPGPKTPAP